jgi:hypothetical protein
MLPVPSVGVVVRIRSQLRKRFDGLILLSVQVRRVLWLAWPNFRDGL